MPVSNLRVEVIGTLEPEKSMLAEPPIQADDTHPTKAVKPAGNRVINGIIWLATVIIFIAAVGIYLQQSSPAVVPTTIAQITVTANTSPTPKPTQPPTTIPAQTTSDSSVPADVIAELSMQPGETVPPKNQIFRNLIAYTIAPVSARSGVVNYTVQSGDDLTKIAAKFGIAQESILWNNDITYVNRLFPGDVLQIPPEDGILYQANGTETIQHIADKYKVSPYSIIDSEYNRLQAASPSFVVPEGVTIFAPGGVSDKQVAYWNPGIVVKPATPCKQPCSPGAFTSGGSIEFGGGAGSCGLQPNDISSGLGNPLPLGTYSIRRGFSAIHSGIDLADPPGTPVFAAGTGRVIFAGWSDWGYGYSIVLAHGALLTLYGHLSRIGVACGQVVQRGAQIGNVGSTGNSTGPHLHFEIREGDTPVDPTRYLSF
jgi:murein DD-endopeptidase MepM/ murein hydrolase activator NlpD